MSGKGRLVLEDGTELVGESFGAEIPTAGEVVFNTGMVGYPEAFTDPSYKGQILVLTYPLVGNYGVPAQRTDEYGLPLGFEAPSMQIAGLIVCEQAEQHSHYTAGESMRSWLRREEVPALANIDTRALTRQLRSRGTMLGAIQVGPEEVALKDPNATDLVSTVSIDSPLEYSSTTAPEGGRRPKVLVVDCGCKTSIMRNLLKRGMDVTRVPHDYYFLDQEFDGLVISSGPGDPQMCEPVIRNCERALALGKPILGICLGHQILALAAGARTFKLPFGHRSQNQPCQLVDEQGQVTERCFITSQNHGYAVRSESIPSDWRVWFVNANDQTIEGVRHASKPFYAVQFHPEASPGPVDTAWIFDDFVSQVKGRCV